MAVPTAPLVDDFNRASLGSDYSAFQPAGFDLEIVGSTELTHAAGYRGSYRDVTTYDRPCEMLVTCIERGTELNTYFGIWLVDSPGSASFDGYKIGTDNLDLILYRVDAGVDVPLDMYTGGADDAVIEGSLVALQVTGTHVVLWTDEGAGWVEQLSVADTNHAGPFFVTIDMFGGGQVLRLDDLHAGEIDEGTITDSNIALPRIGRGSAW